MAQAKAKARKAATPRFEHVGSEMLRVDAADKVRGATKYLGDIPRGRALAGVVVRSDVPRGILRSVTQDPSFDWRGVTVATAADIPGENVVHMHDRTMPLMAAVGAEVRYRGEPIAVVAAPTPEKARAAAAAVKFAIDPLPPLLRLLDDGVERFKADPASLEYLKEQTIEKGDVAAGFRAADRVMEREYRAGHQEQLYLEPQGLCVTPERDGGIRVEGSIQCPYFPATELNDALRLPTEKIRVAQTPMGGAFGGKEDYPSMLAGYAALAALKARRPVRISYERNEDILYTPKRHPVWVRFKIGYKTDGTPTAIDCDYLLDGGAYLTISDVVMYRGILHCALAYACPNVSIRGRVVRTNSMPCGAFRGFGAPQAIWGLESIIDEIAADCGLAPHKYRLKHHIRPGQRTSTGQLLTGENGTTAVLKTALDRSGYAEKLKRCSHGTLRKGQDKLYGIGLSFFGHGSAFTGDGEAKFKAKGRLDLVTLDDGKPGVEIRVSSTEMGQGVHTIFTQIAADALSLDPARIRFPLADTSRVPNSGPTVASRTTMVVGNVVWGAGCDLRRQIETFASTQYFRGAPCRLDHSQLLSDGRKPIPFARAAADLLAAAKAPVSGTYQFLLPPSTDWNQTTFKGDAYPGYSWSADVAEVEVDPVTCEPRVTKITSILDIGRVINPLTAKGQVEGGLVQALGYTVMERTAIGKNGNFDAARLQTYIIPTALDVPEMDIQFVEYPYTFAPPGGKGLGEMPMDGLAPAIANAIEAATGARLRTLPLNAEALFRALHPATAT